MVVTLSLNSAISLRIAFETFPYSMEETLVGLVAARPFVDDMLELVASHRDALWLRRQRLVLADAYGIEDQDEWRSEVHRFFERVVVPRCRLSQTSDAAAIEFLEKLLPVQIASAISKVRKPKAPVAKRTSVAASSARSTSTESAGPSAPEMSAIEFETYCAETLRAAGWRATLTKGSGDQGVDVIARCRSITVVLQCKLYSRPVGNGAVQEIAVGRAYEQAQIAAVVTNSSFTKSAQRLAATADVHLLYSSQLSAAAKEWTVKRK